MAMTAASIVEPLADAPRPPPAVAARPAASRRRYLTIMFSDLSDAAAIAAGLEAEDYAALLGSVRETGRAVIARHGGTIVQAHGGGLLAIFGQLRPSEHDPSRAIDAALELHAQVRALGWPGAMRSGIHSGIVLLDEGDVVRGRFELLGSATNIASRLAAAAAADEILVSEATLGPKRARYVAGERRALRIRGRTKPLAVFGIQDHATPAVAPRGRTAFVGRARELAELERTLDAAIAGEPQRLTIAGAPGMGKTRLAEEIVARAVARGCAVHRGGCDDRGEPLQPVLQILRSILGVDRTMPAAEGAGALAAALARLGLAATAHAAAIARMLWPAADAPLPGEQARAAFGALIERLSRDAPLLLSVDDWHWADDASSALLAAPGALGRSRVLLLLSARASAHAAPAAGATIALRPFTRAEAAARIAQLLHAPDPFLVHEVGAQAGGNPLFIEELCHAIAAGGEMRLERPADGRGWLDLLIGSRFAQLEPEQAALVRIAAVIGSTAPGWLFERLSGRAIDDPLVRSLATEDFVFADPSGGALRFKHGITRDAIYHAIDLAQRRALHAAVAAAFARAARGGGPDFAEELAYHYDAAGDPAEAARHAEIAGDRALAAAALDRAQASYRMALAALDRLPRTDAVDRRWIALTQRLGRAAIYEPARDQLALFEQAVARADALGDAATRCAAAYWLAYITYALGDARAAAGLGARACALAEAIGHEVLAVQARSVLGQALAATGDYDRALVLLDAAHVARRDAVLGAEGAAAGSAYVLACRAAMLADRGRFPEAHACIDAALALVRGTNHQVEASVLGWRSALCLWQGRAEEALDHARAGRAIAERVRTLYVLSMNTALGGYARWLLGEDGEALDAILAATAWQEARERDLFLSLNYGWLAEALVAEGRFAEARHYAARALWRARHGDPLGAAIAHRAMARAATRSDRATHHLARARASAARRGSPREAALTDLCAAEIGLAAGDRAEAARLLDRADAGFAAMAMDRHAAAAAAVRGRIAEPTSR